MTLALEPLSQGTHVRITAQNVPPNSKADHDAGLRQSLKYLARYLS